MNDEGFLTVLPDADEYSAAHIKILPPEEALERMPWLKAETLAAQYGKDKVFIERGLKACRLAGVSEQYFIRRYCQEDKTIPKNDAVEYQSRVIQGLIRERD